MDNSTLIYQKLETFIKKYYWNELLRGAVLFFALGLLYFIFTLIVEYFLWLSTTGRFLLFLLFVFTEIFLFVRYILFPFFQLFKLKKGLNYKEASKIIGTHFYEVKDSLINFIQLSSSSLSNESSELVMASIEQKANNLRSIPFTNAINYNSHKKYFPLLILPFIIVCFLFLTGNRDLFTQSFTRLINYNTVFLPPAPFRFHILNPSLDTEQNKDFILKVETIGKVIPENILIFIGDESYYLENIGNGEFQYIFEKPSSNMSFHFEANNVISSYYDLHVSVIATIIDFQMRFVFPSYLKRNPEFVLGSGNAVIPEGTSVHWELNTKATDKVTFLFDKLNLPFTNSNGVFTFSKTLFDNLDYQVLISNSKSNNSERLNYKLAIIVDNYPIIEVHNAPDSLKLEKNFVLGKISDDYGLSNLQVVYYSKDKPNTIYKSSIPIKANSFDQFVFSFPSNLPVEKGISYNYYFEVFDNDVLHNFKSSKSAVFSSAVLTDSERQDLLLFEQSTNVKDLQNTLKEQSKQLSLIEKIQNSGKNTDQFEFKDQKKIEDFINKQKLQDEAMKVFSEKVRENLDNLTSNDKVADELKKRLDKSSKDINDNKKLLDELKNLNEQLKNEDLLSKLEQLSVKSKNQIKNLKQLVELTKKYYVEQKLKQISDKLDKLANKQENQSDSNKENTLDKQLNIKKEFNDLQKELDKTKRDNNDLKSPIDIKNDDLKEKSINHDMDSASEELQKNNKKSAVPIQKNAAKSMKSIASKLSKDSSSSEKEQLNEDVKMLRQILDNLLAFSLSQEKLMNGFFNLKPGSPAFNKKIRMQQDLKLQFKHVDDSLFAISLRNPKISEKITMEIGKVQYNIDKGLETLSDNKIDKAVSHQQYAVSSANKLGDFLSDILLGMQLSLSSMSSSDPKPGDGQGMQLQDIIKKQEGIGNQLQEGMEKKGEGENKDGNNPNKNGKNMNSKSNSEEGGESGADAVLKLFKEQQNLRDALEKELNTKGSSVKGDFVLDKMKQIEKDILNMGFKNSVLEKILNIKQDLLKLKSALQEQGQDTDRQSISNSKLYFNNANALPKKLSDYLNDIEILNRELLPLRPVYQDKTQKYFNNK